MNIHFANPNVLWFLPLVILPFLIYIFTKRKISRYIVSHLPFVRQASRSTKTSHRIKTLSLLITRSLIILTLIILIGEPTYRIMSQTEYSHTIILIDTSLSMRAHIDNTSLFRKAQTIARLIVRSKNANEHMAILAFDDSITDRIVFSRTNSSIISQINAIKPTYYPTAISNAIISASKHLTEIKTQKNQSSKKRIIVISDFSYDIPLKDRAKKYDIDLTCFDIFPFSIKNATIEKIETEKIYTGEHARIKGIVSKTGKKSETPVSLFVNGKQSQTHLIGLGHQKNELISFTQQFTNSGEHICTLALDDDDLNEDNKRSLVLNVLPQIKILILDGDPGISPYHAETYYLSHALHPVVGSFYLATKIITPEEFSAKLFSQPDMIILANVSRITNDMYLWLHSALSKGKSVIIALGDKTTYNTYRHNEKIEKKIMPGYITGSIKTGDYRIRTNNSSFDIPFDFRTVQVKRFFDVKPNPEAEILLSLTNDNAKTSHPLLMVSRYLGNPLYGFVFLYTSSLDYAWNSMPFKPAYVALWQTIVKQGVHSKNSKNSQQLKKLELIIGDTYWHYFEKSPRYIRITDPKGKTKPLVFAKKDGKHAVEIPAMHIPGIYTLKWIDNEGNKTKRWAVNPLHEEGKFTKSVYKDVYTRVEKYYKNITHYDFSQKTNIEISIRELKSGKKLFMELGFIIFILLIFEFLFMERFFGRILRFLKHRGNS